MARDPSRLRKAYEAKLGKDRVDKLTDQQIGLLSKHYNSLSDGEQSDLDNQIFKGYRTELHEIADSFIEENKPSSDKVSVYTAADKFVDDKKEFAKEQEEKLEDALEETSDKIMDAIDALIAQQKQEFEDFKKQQEEERFRKQTDTKIDDAQRESRVNEILENRKKREQEEKQSKQYEKPIGPDPMQGPKEPPKRTVSPEKDEDWESEVPDQLDSKLDDILEQVRNEPLPQPTKTKRRKTKGKKPVSKKKAGGRKVGLGGSLEEIQENVTETKNALFEMYKVDKKRFEFRKKVDSQLTTLLKAKQAEARLEKEDDEDDEKKKGFFTKVGDEIKSSVKEGLIAGLTMMLLPVITDILRPFFNRDPETEGDNQWWDPLDLIPNPKDMGEEEGEGTVGEEKIQPAETASDPKAVETPQVPSAEATPTAETSRQPVPEATPAATTAPVPLRNTNIPGDSGYQPPSAAPSGIPFRTAATGGKFTGGEQKPLRPITKTQVNISEIRSKTKPLMAATMLPQKVGTLGLLSIAKNIVTPFAALIPEEGRTFFANVFRETASMAGIDGYNIDFGGEESIWDAIKKMIFGGGDDDKPDTPPRTPSGEGKTVDVPVGSDEEEYLLRLLNAEAGGEGELGMAAVARSVLNRAGLIQSGEVGAGTFLADSGSITDVINAGGQYQPVAEGKLEKELTPEQRARAKRALEMARNTEELRSNLQKEGMTATQVNNIMASTGFRNYDGGAGYDASQDVNETKLGAHTFNTAGNANMLTPSADGDRTGQPGVEPAPPPSSSLPLQPNNPTSERPSIEQGETFMDKLMRMAGQGGPQPTTAPSAPPELPTINTRTGTYSNRSGTSRSASQQPSF